MLITCHMKRIEKLVIALCDTANRGKSSTLLALSRFFRATHPFDYKEISCVPPNPQHEVSHVFSINGQNVVIDTQGDAGPILESRLTEYLDEYTPALIFCACRTRGAPLEVVSELNNKGYVIVYSSPYFIEGTSGVLIEAHVPHLNTMKAMHLLEVAQNISSAFN